MRTKDHALLGRFLLERYGARLDAVCRRSFLLGCVEPDWNLVSYARGSLKYQFLHGHNAENAEKHLVHLIQKLQESGVQTPPQWFRFGVALHYLADRFTFAHNQIFAGGLKEHSQYEHLLHTVLIESLQTQPWKSLPVAAETHQQYLADVRAYGTDCRYILGTALGLCDQLQIQWASSHVIIRQGA